MKMPDDRKPFCPLSPDLPRRASAIIELPDGLLVAAPHGARFALPGGIAHRGELRSQALIRELREGTGLRINSMLYLFDHITPLTAHKVYLAIAQGKARAQAGIGRIALVSSPETELDLDYETRTILRRYARLRAETTPKGDALRGILGLARYIAKVG
jgi:ADP-ribose pyrophosphatase YjhB (NUDIX family)